MTELLNQSTAVLSECGKYRYRLSRRWGDGATCMFIMLNPSTADATEDDPTIRRCIAYAKSWGYGELVVTNLFAFRATNPLDMKAACDPIGPDNRRHIQEACQYVQPITAPEHECGEVVCAWGAHGSYMDQGNTVLGWLADVPINPCALALTKDGQPRHPLYLKGDLRPRLLGSDN